MATMAKRVSPPHCPELLLVPQLRPPWRVFTRSEAIELLNRLQDDAQNYTMILEGMTGKNSDRICFRFLLPRAFVTFFRIQQEEWPGSGYSGRGRPCRSNRSL